MFKVFSKNLLSESQPYSADLQKINLELLAKYCQIEDWSASADTGIFTLGDLSAFKHDIHSPTCGMLNLINSYRSADRDRIAELFETVCAQNSTFSYSTMIIGPDGFEQPIMVIGESIINNGPKALIKGIFIYPHFQHELKQKFHQ